MNHSNDKHAMIKEYLMPTIVLVIICFVVTFALVTTYKATAPIIKATAEKSAEAARDQVLSGSGGFKLITVKPGEQIVEIYEANKGIGYVIISEDQGYGGEIKVITGLSKTGLVENVMLLEQNETPGLGTKAADKEFTDRFKGLDSIESVESVDTISGATISSSAVKRAVAAAIDQMSMLKEGGL